MNKKMLKKNVHANLIATLLNDKRTLKLVETLESLRTDDSNMAGLDQN